MIYNNDMNKLMLIIYTFLTATGSLLTIFGDTYFILDDLVGDCNVSKLTFTICFLLGDNIINIFPYLINN